MGINYDKLPYQLVSPISEPSTVCHGEPQIFALFKGLFTSPPSTEKLLLLRACLAGNRTTCNRPDDHIGFFPCKLFHMENVSTIHETFSFYSGEAAYRTGKLFCYICNTRAGCQQLEAVANAYPDQARQLAHQMEGAIPNKPHTEDYQWPNGAKNRAEFMMTVAEARINAYRSYFDGFKSNGPMFFLQHNKIDAKDTFFSDGGKVTGSTMSRLHRAYGANI